MNKLLALSVALTSLSLYGVEVSRTGLEGIAIGGLDISVGDYSKVDKRFDKKAIENQVELRLRQSGIKRNKDANNYLLINAIPVNVGGRIVGHALIIEAKRAVDFRANGNTYLKTVAVWDEMGIAPANRLRETINTYIDEFLLDYLKANPKKKEKE